MNDDDRESSSASERTEESQAQTAPRPGCLVVGMGASAGGLEAFEQFFTHMPPDSGMAFVLVQHLAPDHVSLLPELLAKYTRMSVQQVTTATPVAPDHVYVIPPDATLTIADGVLHLESPPAEPRGHRTPIDHFFRSLAADQGENAVCIILSGTGTDGTLGLQAVKEYGGMAMAQTMESAQYDSILRSAIATGLVDHTLPVAEMPAKLVEYAAHLTALRENGGSDGFRKEVNNSLATIHTLLRRQTGHDFSQYKESTIHRCLQRRMQALQLDAVDEYVTRLRKDPTELEFLFKDLLIGVTNFFRDPEAFTALAREVIPILEHYAPAGVVVTTQGDAVHFSGRTGRYLEPPSGAPNVNVLNMAREGLRLPLRTALHQAVTRRQRVVDEQVPVKTNGDVQPITLVVQPLTTNSDTDATLYLIIFQDVSPAGSTAHTEAKAAAPDLEDEQIRRLENELRASEERLRSTTEELETSNEELQSANEEFQSTNEELVTSKEELQSLNEELETVNTELRRKVEDLNRVNSDLQNLLDSTQIATLFLDREMHIRNFTPATRTLLRITPGDIGRPIADFAQRFVGADLVSEAQDVLNTRATHERQLHLMDADTRYLMRLLPYRTVENVIDGVAISFVDVTDLKRAEEAASTAQLYAESIVETVRESLLILTADLRVRSANQSFYEAFHSTSAETEGCLLYDLGNGQWNIPELRRVLTEVLPQNKSFEDFAVTHDFPAIGHKTMLLNARQIEARPDQEALILLAIEDVTASHEAKEALRASEERYRTLFESIDEGFCVVEVLADENEQPVDYRFLEVNPAFAEQTGLEHALGKRMRELAPQHEAQWFEMYGRVAQTGDSIRFEHRAQALDRWFGGYAYRYGRPEDRQVAVIFRDITAHRQMEEERERLLAELQRVNAELRQYSYVVAHDLNEPLRTMRSFLDLFARRYQGQLDTTADEYIAFVTDAAQRMQQMITDLLAYTRVGGQGLKLTPVDGEALLARVFTDLQMAIADAQAQVTHDPLPTVQGDATLLGQVLQNLIGNALKFRRNELLHIHISAQRDGNHWRFAVEDNGIGIDPTQDEHIFRVFQRLHTYSEYPGTGIGLAICKKIIEQHGGRIWVESQPGEGSTFYFTVSDIGGGGGRTAF